MSALAFTRYAMARWAERDRRESFRIYVGDSINALGRGEYIKQRYSDLVRRGPRDERSAEEIADSVIEQAGLEVL